MGVLGTKQFCLLEKEKIEKGNLYSYVCWWEGFTGNKVMVMGHQDPNQASVHLFYGLINSFKGLFSKI